MASWYCAIDGQLYGPFSTDQLRALAQEGRLRPQDQIRRADSDKWTPASKVRGLFEPASTTQPASGPSSAAQHATPVAHNDSRAAKPPVASPVAPPVAPSPAVLPTAIPLHPTAAIPVASAQPVLTPVPAAVVTPDAHQRAKREIRSDTRRKSRQQTQMIVGGLGAALLVLIIAAVFLMGWSPRQRGPAAESVETDPIDQVADGLETDIESDPATILAETTPARQSSDERFSPRLPSVGRWLAAGSQKRVIGDHLRLHVAAVWWATGPVPPATLVVEVEVTNISTARPLEYFGWAAKDGANDGQPALLLADADSRPTVARADRDPATGSAGLQRLVPKQMVSRRLEFSFAEVPAVDRFRLILPYAAWGLKGQAGFEIPTAMILDGPPEAASPPVPQIAGNEAGEGFGNEPRAMTPAPEPETIGDLKAQIEADFKQPDDDRVAAEPNDPMMPADPAEPEDAMPDSIQDLRRSIEQSRQSDPRDHDEMEPDDP